jgi:hypothetical protein
MSQTSLVDTAHLTDHAEAACNSCTEGLGIFYQLLSDADIDQVVSTIPGRAKVREIIAQLSQTTFPDRTVSFGIIKLSQGMLLDGEVNPERFCFSFRPNGMDLSTYKTAFTAVYGFAFDSLGSFPSTFTAPGSSNIMDAFVPGDFNYMLRFNDSSTPLAGVPARRRREDSGSAFEITFGSIDSFYNPRSSLSTIYLPSFQIGPHSHLSRSYFKIFFLGIG